MMKPIVKQSLIHLFRVLLFFVLIYFFVEDKNLANSVCTVFIFFVINVIFELASYLIKKSKK